MTSRVFAFEWSLPILLLTIIILAFTLYATIQNKRIRIYIPMIVTMYALFYCWLQIYYLAIGYDGIIYVLISWGFLVLLSLLIMRVIWQERQIKKFNS